MFQRRIEVWPTPETLYDWLMARLDLPPDSIVSSGFWRFPQLQFSAPQNLVLGHDLGADFPSLRALWSRFPIAAAGLAEFFNPYLDWEELETEANGGFLDARAVVEAILRRHIELYGRAWVSGRDLEPYADILKRANPDFSHHEQLETVLGWRDLGLFAPRDEQFCANFPEILAAHQRFLRGEGGVRAQLCGRDLREVSWEKGALRGADLRGAIVRNLNLENEDFAGCDWRGANCLANNFRGANLEGCDFRFADLELALFERAHIKDARWNRVRDYRLIDWDGRGLRGHFFALSAAAGAFWICTGARLRACKAPTTGRISSIVICKTPILAARCWLWRSSKTAICGAPIFR